MPTSPLDPPPRGDDARRLGQTKVEDVHRVQPGLPEADGKILRLDVAIDEPSVVDAADALDDLQTEQDDRR